MEKNKLPNFIIIWHEDKAALIDPEGKVCLGVSRYIAENINQVEVQEKLYPIWQQQAQIRQKVTQEHEKINTAYLMVTRQCNMNCDFCAISANKKMDLQREFTLIDIQDKVIPFLKKCTPHKLILTGGEPLIKDRIIEIASALHKELSCPIVLQSNGLKINSEIVKGLSGEIRQIDFSTKHMFENRNKEDMLKYNIEICKKAGIDVLLTFVYERENKDDLYKVIDIAAQYDTMLQINVVAPVGMAKEGSYILTDNEKIEMDLDIAEYIYKQKYETKILANILGGVIQVEKSCGAYGRVMAIFPEGNIYMCQCLEEPKYCMGNILTNTAEDIQINLEKMLLDNEIKATFHVESKDICNECDYRYLCTGKCPISADQEDYDCYYIKKKIDYRLFSKANISKREALEEYIDFLRHLKNNFE